jgi:hypothetical protein
MILPVAASDSGTQSLRYVLSLNGSWQIAEGQMDSVPVDFDRMVKVPGLASLAVPAFTNPPGPAVASRRSAKQKDPQRDAFWYRRTFRLDQPVPEVAVLKVHKAMFGTRVLLNGQILGDHLPCFTPGYFNTKPALKTGLNELLIRIGADRDAVGPSIPSGLDFEKERYIPGIFDSVELILSGTPHFIQVQIAPDISTGAVHVQAVLRNEGEPVETAVTFVVREEKSGREVGRITSPPACVAKSSEITVEGRIVLADCRLWSPEDPFLYRLEADSGADRFQTRFGMREFRFDPATGRAMLNGKPYFMRGSNVTLYRFFEDSECGYLPWREDWVRLFHQRMKEMHWNCLRYCIGFPPEAWYDIADEIGILIQDEFPIWSHTNETKSEQLAAEYTEWMKERWNHPCVVIWDANNETKSTETSLAIQQVRHLDLSDRPWDNGWGPPGRQSDPLEAHPYHFIDSNYKLSDLAKSCSLPSRGMYKNSVNKPIVINEYGWLWLNRDGTPTTLTEKLYENLLGPNSTTAQRRHLYALYLSAVTEFWRTGRACAAVMHFTALGYSRHDGQTSDHWNVAGVEALEWEPEFYRYVRDAFAPVALSINFWKDRLLPQTQSRIPVVLINDLEQSWNGQVTLRLKGTGAPLIEHKQQVKLDPFGRAAMEFEVTWPETCGRYTLEAELCGDDGQPVRSVREIEVVDPLVFGHAYQKPVSASSSHNAEYLPEYAVDGDVGTFWSSAFADTAWLVVNLGETRRIHTARITWENAYSEVFTLQVSRDGKKWTDVFTEENGKGGVSEIELKSVAASHVRVVCSKRGTQWGHAIRELEIF